MSKFALSYGSQKTRLATAVGAAPLVAAKLALFTNALVPSPANILADFTEALFGGYTAGGQAVTWGAVGLDPNGIPVAPASLTWTYTGVPAETILGCYLLDSTGALVGAAAFDSPVSMSVVGDQVTMTLLFGLTDGSLTVAVGP